MQNWCRKKMQNPTVVVGGTSCMISFLLNLSYERQNVSVVSGEPMLFHDEFVHQLHVGCSYCFDVLFVLVHLGGVY